MPETQRTDESIFAEALGKSSPGERAAFLDQVCGADRAWRERIETLIRSHDQAGSFLKEPLAAPRATIAEPSITEGPGTVIGRYKLLQQIGEGGFGTVYMAEQKEPVRRRVALKIIKLGMDTREVIARFEAERQALALMDHPNIAKVLDAGATETGRPYFVMELVKGVSLTEFSDQNQLSAGERLELFVAVCQAVQHAHQKGVIHRDLKPSNILVTLHDGKAVPKVIDFGVAKALNQELTEKTLFTAFGHMIGTPQYMSPEQAEMSGLDVDTRSDIYSLGVVLYELLTGTTPLEARQLRSAAYAEMQRLIREEEAPRPSLRVSTLGERLSVVARDRHCDPAQLQRLLRGELDWIVMKALDKDRTRRYETANGLARDVERYLHDEPVEACPPTTGYKLRKFARKNQKLLATAAAFLVLLLLGVAGSAWQAVRATQAEAAALANKQQANEHATQAEKERDEVRALNEKLQDTQGRLRSTLYAAHINLAQHAWEEGALPRARELLEHYRPEPGEPDLRGFEWHYLHRLCQGDQLFTLPKGWNMVFSPDGKRLITIGGDRPKELGHRPAPELKTWDAQTGQELRRFTLNGDPEGIMVFSADAQRLASGSHGEVKVWDTQTGQELHTFKGGSNEVVFSPDGKRLASPSGREVKLWDVQTGEELPALEGPTAEINALAFSLDGHRLACAFEDKDKTVKVWDAQSGQELLSLKHPDWVYRLAFSPDGKRLLSASGFADYGVGRDDHAVVKIWDIQTGQVLLSVQEESKFTFLALSPDGKRIATADANESRPRIKVRDAQSGQVIFTFQEHKSWIRSLAFSSDSKRLASSPGDGTLRIWDLETGEEIRTLRGHTAHTLIFSPDGKRLASAGGDVKVWDAQRVHESIQLKGIAPAGSSTGPLGGRVVFTPNLRHVADCIPPGRVRVFNAQNGRRTLTIEGHTEDMIRSLAYSPDGKYLASGDGKHPFGGDGRPVATRGAVKVWDAQTGRELHTLKGHVAPVGSLAFSPDGKRLASASADLMVKVWETKTGKELLSIEEQPFRLNHTWGVCFSPDGKRLAIFSQNRVRVWDAQTGQQLLTIEPGLPWLFDSVAFDGRRIAGVFADTTVKVWDAQTGVELLSFKGHTDRFYSVVFSPDGKRLLTVSADMIKIWDALTGQELLSLKAHAGERGWVAFSSEGHRLGSVSGNGTVKIWDATPLPEKP
jgi:WD40 repeat protein/serine/threonine protein kinase